MPLPDKFEYRCSTFEDAVFAVDPISRDVFRVMSETDLREIRDSYVASKVLLSMNPIPKEKAEALLVK